MKMPLFPTCRRCVVVFSLLMLGGWATKTSAATTLTLAATVKSSRTVTLNASINPQGVATTAWFEWGATTNYGSSTTITNLGSGTMGVFFLLDLTGLSPASTYHYRGVARSSSGTNFGADVAFRTMTNLWTLPATVLSTTSVSLNGQVSPDGIETSAWFEWGTTTNYGSSTTATNLGSGTDAVQFSFNLTGLAPGNTYYYRAVAADSTSTNNGDDLVFTMNNLIDEASLRAAINAGGTFAFPCDGTITLSNTLVISNSIVLDGSGHNVTISGGGNVRVFLVTTGASLTLRHLTIMNGKSTNGAGIYNDGGTVNIFDSIVSNNSSATNYPSSSKGGGVYNRGGSLNIRNTTFSFNTAGGTNGHSELDSFGGALLNDAGVVVITTSRFIGNTTQRYQLGPYIEGYTSSGGAIYNQGDLRISLSTFLTNMAVCPSLPSDPYPQTPGHFGGIARGGAICNFGTCWLSGNAFLANGASGGTGGDGGNMPWGLGGAGGQAIGGAIYQGSNALVVLGCAFASNYVTGKIGGRGGDGIPDAWLGIGFDGGPGGNGGSGLGAGVAAVGGLVFATNNSFANNQARSGNGGQGGIGHWYAGLTGGGRGGQGGNGGNAYAGALYVDGATVYCLNNTFGWNTASVGVGGSGGSGDRESGANGTNGGAIGGLTRMGGTLTLANNIVAYSSPMNNSGTLVDFGYNISSDGSCNFTGTGSRNNTDPGIQPLADNGGPTLTFALELGSPAIDAGESAGAPATDQRGVPRGVCGSVDIGSFELCTGWPTVTTLPATSLSSTTATLNGNVNANSLATTAWFEWGATTNYGSTAMTTNVGSGTNAVLLSFNLNGLSPNSTNHYRVVARSSAITNYGADVAFTTLPIVPTVVTLPVTICSATAATLNGLVNPNGMSTRAWFEWGTTTNYGSSTSRTNLGSGASAVLFSLPLTGLSPGTTYHYQAMARNLTPSTNWGVDLTFTTAPPVLVISNIAHRPGEAFWLRCNVGSGTTATVQVATNLVDWVNFTNRVADASGWFEVIDSEATNCPRRFYRLRW